MNKSVYLGFLILELGNIWLCNNTKILWKIKIILYGYGQFHCIHKTDNIFEEIAEDVKTRLETSNYGLDRPLPKGKNEKQVN